MGDVYSSASWRRHRVLKSGTDQSKPINCKRLSTKPIVWRVDIVLEPFMDGSSVARAFVDLRRLVGCGHLFGVEIAARRLRALMKLRVSPWIPINDTRSKALRFKQGIPAICPSVGHHATLHLTVSSEAKGPVALRLRARPRIVSHFSTVPRRSGPYGWPRRWRPASRSSAARFATTSPRRTALVGAT